MKIYLSLLAILFTLSNIHSQRIGDDAQIFLYLIEQDYISRKTKDLLKFGELQYTYDLKYNDEGLIDEITVNQKNVFFYDLEARSDIEVWYNFSAGKLIQTMTKYFDLPYEYVKKKFDEKYSRRYHGFDHYFSPDYKYTRFIFKNFGHATILYTEFIPSNAENPDFHNVIRQKQEDYQIKEKLEEEVNLKLESFNTGYFNIDDFREGYSTEMIPKIEQAIVKMFKEELNNSFNYNQKVKLNEIKGQCRLRVYADNQTEYSNVELECSKLSMYYKTLLYKVELRMPYITKTYKEDDYYINREFFMNCKIDLVRGMIEIKNKKGKLVEFLSENKLTEEQKDWISQEMKERKSGKYSVMYQFGKINEVDATAMYIKRK